MNVFEEESGNMVLDPAIRDWVLVPIMVVMVLVGVLRHQVTSILTSPPPRPTLKAVREAQALARCSLMHSHGDHLVYSKFDARRNSLLEDISAGNFLKTGPKNAAPPNPMTDPAMMEQMMGGMKKNVVMVVPQTIIMAWINFFFSGFVLIRLPFPLTLRFKSMLQTGILTSDMDVAWVSSLSWYFLNLFGLRAVFALILGDENTVDGFKDMQAMNMPNRPGPRHDQRIQGGSRELGSPLSPLETGGS
ncbi:hypothetical protein DSO57_1026518 [Entomophthora muscae]|uniref:Uncharacterized protein n=1 Tax=Entomophthora muscae TaxID=34485 RepID=A0ACC2TPB9_9FUNG|nr:hypothetical protein DSO57_1026518 [Entomophthora muscae]